MRKLLFTVLILVVVGVAAGLVWIFQGPRITLYFDRFGIAIVSSDPIRFVRYQGNGSGGALYVNEVLLSLDTVLAPVQPPSVGSTKDGKLGLASGGKVFPLGKLPTNTDEAAEALATSPDPDDDARILLGHSQTKWPTPFEVNFMSGASASWKRYSYQQLIWKKPNGPRLEMLWRYRQHFDKANGWTSPTMTQEGETGLVKIEITP